MKNTNDAASNKSRDERLMKLQRKLEQALIAKPPSAQSAFTEAYELIEIGMRRGLAQKDIIQLVNETYDLKLHAASFRELLKTERASRTAEGHRAVCHTCGHNLAPTAPDDQENPSHKGTTATSLREVA